MFILFSHLTFKKPLKVIKEFGYTLGILICLLTNVTSYAQVYPVIVNTNLRAPYSLNLSDYAAPGYDRIITNIYMSDLTKVNYPVKLRLTIRGEGGVNLTTLPGQEVGPIYLNGGQTTTLTGMDINGLFNPEKLQFSGISLQQYRQNSALPEGLYQFQFEVIDYNLNVPISNSNVGFSTAWLILNDPPIINQPDREVTIVPLPQQNVLFQWTPRHTGSPNSAFTTVYDLQLVEIYPAGRNANDAMLTSPVIFEKTLYSTSYNYTLADPYLFPGKWYAFRVRAHDADGRDFFKNQGYSEVYRFYYGGPCTVPANVKVTDVDPTSAVVSWDLETTHNTTELQYKERTASNWKKITSYSNSELIEKLTPRTNYVFKLSGACANNTSVFSDEINYMTTGGSSGKECDLPLKESVTATAVTMTDVKISWLTEEWFTSYNFRYKELGAAQFTEVKSVEASILLRSLDVDKIYEYQILYLCQTGVWVEGGFNTFKATVPPDVLTGGGTGDCFAPLDITHEVKEDLTVYISWPKEKDTKSYMVYWKEDVQATSWFSQEVSSPKIILENLIPGTDYVYEVKSICKTGGLSLSSKQGKFNTTYVPLVSKVCNAPKLKPVEIISADEAKLSWEIDPDHNGYILEYRVQGTKIWVASKETNPYKLISGLDNTKKYEYHVYAFCGQVSSDFSVIDPFSTAGAPAKQFVCGSGQGLINITNRTPIASLKVGDKFKAADFEVTITVLTSNGPYNGEASAKVPYLKNSSFVFGMENVQVNELNQMFAGKIYLKKTNLSIIDPAIAAKINGMLDKVDQGFTTLEGYLATVAQLQDDVNNYISSAEGGNNVGQVVTGNVAATNTATVAITNATQINGTRAGNSQCKLVIAGDNGANQTLNVAAPSTLMDTKGTIYSIDANCSATKVAENIVLGKTPAELDNLSDKALVTFVDYTGKQKFGFSSWNEEYTKSPTDWAKRYQLLGSVYRVPSKLIEPASVDLVKASISVKDASIDKTKVIFVTGKGVKFASKSLGGNDYELSIAGGPDKDAQEVYALYPEGDTYISFGKVLVPAYKHKKRTLVLVPVNGSSISETVVSDKLNEIYNKYAIDWEVKKDADFVDNTWDYNGIPGLQIEGSGAFSTLTDEMVALNKVYESKREIDPTNVYLFVVGKSETTQAKGDMPRAKQFGYLFREDNSDQELASISGHEVGHGLFLLRHTFDGYGIAQNALPDNLMDYSGGEKLEKLQWDIMHDPGIVLGVFDKDEDAMGGPVYEEVKLKIPAPEGPPTSVEGASAAPASEEQEKGKYPIVGKDLVLNFHALTYNFVLDGTVPPDFPAADKLKWKIKYKNDADDIYLDQDLTQFIAQNKVASRSAKVNLKDLHKTSVEIVLYVTTVENEAFDLKDSYYMVKILPRKIDVSKLVVTMLDSKSRKTKRVATDGLTLWLIKNNNVNVEAIDNKVKGPFTSDDLSFSFTLMQIGGQAEVYTWPYSHENIFDRQFSGVNWPAPFSTSFLHTISVTDGLGHVKTVNVKTLKTNNRATELVDQSTKAWIDGINAKAEKFVGLPARMINKIVPEAYQVQCEIDPIKTGNEVSNEEDPASRFYYMKEKGYIVGGVTLESKNDIPIPALSQNFYGYVQVGAYIKPFISFTVDAGIEKQKRNDRTTYDPYNDAVNFKLTGGIEAGLKAELLKGKDYVDFEVKGFAKASASGFIEMSLVSKKFEVKAQIDPLVLGYSIHIASKDPIEFDLVDFEDSFTVTDPYMLYESDSQ